MAARNASQIVTLSRIIRKFARFAFAIAAVLVFRIRIHSLNTSKSVALMYATVARANGILRLSTGTMSRVAVSANALFVSLRLCSYHEQLRNQQASMTDYKGQTTSRHGKLYVNGLMKAKLAWFHTVVYMN